MNYYTIELIARDVQSDRTSEAAKQRRWQKARKAMQKLNARAR
ncbi:MAG TPA: hypothetical protein VEW94_02480 [Chloroflexia bacterium]|jgi:hypothetical protein|nr:hypothetical protein [Chloroflexia bacterium]